MGQRYVLKPDAAILALGRLPKAHICVTYLNLGWQQQHVDSVHFLIILVKLN